MEEVVVEVKEEEWGRAPLRTLPAITGAEEGGGEKTEGNGE